MGVEEVDAVTVGEEEVLAHGEQPALFEKPSGKEEVVERILQHRYHTTHGDQYKVKWEGYSSIYNSWVRAGDLHCPKVLAEFEEARKKKGAPP